MLDFDRYRAVSFDCYGTLVDWESGILAALRPVLARHDVVVPDDRLLEIYAAAESEAEAGDFIPYRDVLRRVMKRLGGELGFVPSAAETECLAGSVRRWMPFPDTVEALTDLKRRFKLVVISNIDDDLFRATAQHLRVEFDLVTTAGQVRSYKPRPEHFVRTIEKLGMPRDSLLHVAQSRFHDIAPAASLGLSTVWVNRRADRPGSGATPPAGARPDIEVPDLRTLVSLIFGDRQSSRTTSGSGPHRPSSRSR